eukprot:CAMPEP_0201934492 /NCGR_PEP_ID=MMETSP0903-20130614/33723_1 /ASSEMBLY_ACC=CAM_ASM_000552 /TAXON_ID=420261 /ORGANISM="Thalassiosira antarctica, Strain CCMP982" /LENGTH=238 /DNA_ID=CAMNT_0048474721 /DNA_START=74 /DNA_END=790 /DNA_ORIENTATION=-
MALIAVLSGNNLAYGFSAAPIRQFAPQIIPSSNIKVSTTARFKRGTLPHSSPLFSAPNEDDESNDQESQQEVDVVDDSLTSSQIESQSGSFLSNIKGIFTNKSKFNRESLSKLGMSALLAYGFVSNVSGVIAVSSAWFIFSKRTGLSPLSNKPAFLLTYAGFTVALNVIRPARFALSMAISPYFDRIRNYFQRKFGVSAKAATVLVVVFINLLGTCSLMGLGVGLASVLSGVPVWAGK